MKRAGILLIVLAVLAISWMAAANIVVADTGDDARYESKLLSGSREGGEGVRILGYGHRSTVNTPDMYFNLDYDAGTGTSESSFQLGSQDSEIDTDYGTYNFDIFSGLNTGGSSSGGDGFAIDDLPLPCAIIAEDVDAGETSTATMRLADICDYWPVKADFWNRETDKELNEVLSERLLLPVPEDTIVEASVTRAEDGCIREYDCNIVGGTNYYINCLSFPSSYFIYVTISSLSPEGSRVPSPGPLYHMDTEFYEEMELYMPVTDSFRLLFDSFASEIHGCVEVPGCGVLMLISDGAACRLVQFDASGELVQDLDLSSTYGNDWVEFYAGDNWVLVDHGGVISTYVPEGGVFVPGPTYDLTKLPAYDPSVYGNMRNYNSKQYAFDGERLASLIEVRFRWFGNPIYQDDSFPDEPRDALLYLAVATPEEVLLSEELYPTLYNNGLNLWYTIEME